MKKGRDDLKKLDEEQGLLKPVVETAWHLFMDRNLADVG